LSAIYKDFFQKIKKDFKMEPQTRSQLRDLRNKFVRLDELLNSFARDPRPLEDFTVWRERFEALFMQLYNLKIPTNISSLLSVHPAGREDIDQGMVEALLRTRPMEIRDIESDRLDIELLQKRAEILLSNMDHISEKSSSEESPADSQPEEANLNRLIEAIKFYYQ
jgi:hypothetical protein